MYINTSSAKGCLPAFQRVLDDSCEPERCNIQKQTKVSFEYMYLYIQSVEEVKNC